MDISIKSVYFEIQSSLLNTKTNYNMILSKINNTKFEPIKKFDFKLCFSKFFTIRDSVIIYLFEVTNKTYRAFKKREKWGLSIDQLLRYPNATIGQCLGKFLLKNNFEILDKSETHDVFHILTGYSTDVVHEIEMQFFLFGNGKRSPYLFLGMITGYLIYPEYVRDFRNAIQKGKTAMIFHNLPYLSLLNKNLNDLQLELNLKTIQL